MVTDARLLGESYLQHCTEQDLALLAASLPGRAPEMLRREPALLAELMGDEAVRAAVFGAVERDDGLFVASPFLVFAVAVGATRAELASSSYVEEWLGPRHRAPVFDVASLRDFLADGWRRLFLAELLASYTKVQSGSIPVPTRRGMRRHRFSELDPVRLASLLDVLDEREHPGIYRRLGDLSLFLTGVFPDHTALHGLSDPDEARLLRAGRLDPRRPPAHGSLPGFGDASAVELLEELGRRWYRLAVELVPPPRPRALGPIGELARRFSEARRILNVLTDHYLFPMRRQFFGFSSS